MSDHHEIETEELVDTGDRMLSAFAMRTSRKGFLQASGRIFLRMLGISIIPFLPVDRIVRRAEAADLGCSDWRLEGIYGRICCSRCTGGATSGTCPSCATKGSAWCFCTSPHLGHCITILYWDCCTSTPSTCNCPGCAFCTNNTPQPVWCSGKSYVCTFIQTKEDCPC